MITCKVAPFPLDPQGSFLILSALGYRPESDADLNRYLELFLEQKKLVYDESRYRPVARS
jgi:hypothetical protein